MAVVTEQINAFTSVTVERVTTGTGKNRTENDTHLLRFDVTNVHATAVIRGWVEVNNAVDKESGPLQPGQSWAAIYPAPGLATPGGTTRVGWGIQEV